MAGTGAGVSRHGKGRGSWRARRWHYRGGGGRRKIGGEMVVEEGVIGFPIRSHFKGGFSKEHVMAMGVTPESMDKRTSLP
jgi:hypothetical protein